MSSLGLVSVDLDRRRKGLNAPPSREQRGFLLIRQSVAQVIPPVISEMNSHKLTVCTWASWKGWMSIELVSWNLF